MARMSHWVLLGASLTATACGGDDGSNEPLNGRLPEGTRSGSAADSEPSSGVPGTRSIAALSLSEAQQICEWSLRLELAIEEATVAEQCVLYAPLGSLEECETARDACVEDYETYTTEPTEQEIAESAAFCVGFLALGADAACQAAVAELEACVRDDARAYEQDLGGLSCESALASDADAAGWEELEQPESPASCKLLEEKCPTWFLPTEEEEDDWDDSEGESGFVCDDGWEIAIEWVCDGTPDCDTGEDEDDCFVSEASEGVSTDAVDALRARPRHDVKLERP